METPTLDNLDVPIMDEYDRKEMENLEMVTVENPHNENAVPRYVWNHPNFEDISAWETNQPADEYMGGNFGQPDLRESLGVGTSFDSKELVIHAMRKWWIMNRVEYRVKKSNPSFMVFQCRQGRDVCPWGLRIAALRGSHRWEVRKHRHHHICQKDTIISNNFHMTPKYIANELWDVMTKKLRLSEEKIQARIAKDYGLEISALKAWQAKQQTMINLFGTWDGSFADLPHLMKALVDHSLETVVKWDTKEINGEYIQVNRVFWAFVECIHAFKHCRPILSIDGTHMYESFNGILKHRRDLPISALVMFTFKQLNKYFNTRRYRYDNTDSAFAPKVHQRLPPELSIISGKFAYPREHVTVENGRHFIFLTVMQIAACKFANKEYSDYVPHEYTLQAYNMTWSYHFSQLPHSDFWEPYDGLPHRPNPHFKRTNVGRNPTRRRRTEMDQRDVGQSSTRRGFIITTPGQNSKVQNYAIKLVITKGLVPSPMQAKSNIRVPIIVITSLTTKQKNSKNRSAESRLYNKIGSPSSGLIWKPRIRPVLEIYFPKNRIAALRSYVEATYSTVVHIIHIQGRIQDLLGPGATLYSDFFYCCELKRTVKG
ncbi:hypothetical protein QQ045_016133 [Rhodiola kirilowii]